MDFICSFKCSSCICLFSKQLPFASKKTGNSRMSRNMQITGSKTVNEAIVLVCNCCSQHNYLTSWEIHVRFKFSIALVKIRNLFKSTKYSCVYQFNFKVIKNSQRSMNKIHFGPIAQANSSTLSVNCFVQLLVKCRTAQVRCRYPYNNKMKDKICIHL